MESDYLAKGHWMIQLWSKSTGKVKSIEHLHLEEDLEISSNNNSLAGHSWSDHKFTSKTKKIANNWENNLGNYVERGRYEDDQDEFEEENYPGLLNAPDRNAGSGDIMVQLTQIDGIWNTSLQ